MASFGKKNEKTWNCSRMCFWTSHQIHWYVMYIKICHMNYVRTNSLVISFQSLTISLDAWPKIIQWLYIITIYCARQISSRTAKIPTSPVCDTCRPIQMLYFTSRVIFIDVFFVTYLARCSVQMLIHHMLQSPVLIPQQSGAVVNLLANGSTDFKWK